MFSSALVCLLAGLRKNYSTDFHNSQWKGDTWATLDFGGNPDHVMLELGLWLLLGGAA